MVEIKLTFYEEMFDKGGGFYISPIVQLKRNLINFIKVPLLILPNFLRVFTKVVLRIKIFDLVTKEHLLV